MNNMKKRMNFWLMAALVCGLSLGVTSCKDDDDDNGSEKTSTVTLDSDLLTRGIETEMKSAAIDVKVTADGLWTANLGKNADWVMIKDWQVTYEGSQTLTLLFDENPTGYDRTTTLTIGNSDGEFQKVTVRQTPLVDGKAPTNGSGLAFAGQGVGCGIDYDYVLNVYNKANSKEKFEPTKIKKPNNIFNIAYIEDLQKNGGLGPSAYTETPISISELTAQMLDSSMVKVKDVNFNLKLSISFGAINFSAQGAYTSKKTQTESAVDYVINRFAPMYNVVVSPAEIRAYAVNKKNNKIDAGTDNAAEDEIDAMIERYAKINKRRGRTGLNANGLTAEQQTEIDAMYDQLDRSVSHTFGGVFSGNFTSAYNKLYNALVPTKKDYTAADQVLNQLDNDYGPFFIAGGDFGGGIVVHCHALDRMLDGNGTFSGHLAAAAGGHFNVSGSFSYTEEGLETLHECNPDLYIYGGSAIKTTNTLMDIILGQKVNDRERWLTALKDWVNSMYTADDNKPSQSMASPLSFIVEPIWTLFDEPAIQEYVQNYFIKKYEDRGIKGYLRIGLGLDVATADDLLNKNSDFNKNSKNKDVPQISQASGNYNQAPDKK